jgi:hypothetical protein
MTPPHRSRFDELSERRKAQLAAVRRVNNALLRADQIESPCES